MKLKIWLRKLFKRPLTIYYAHSLRKYNTPMENRELFQLREKFPKDKIINPKNFPYKNWWSGKEKMEYCYNFIRNNADIVVFTNYKGYIGRGVFMEISVARLNKVPVKYLYRGKLHNNFRAILFNPQDWAIYYAKVELEN